MTAYAMVTCREYTRELLRSAADVWTEDLVLTGAQVRGRYVGGPADGAAAITRHELGAGVGWYVRTRLDTEAVGPVLAARDGGATSRRVVREVGTMLGRCDCR